MRLIAVLLLIALTVTPISAANLTAPTTYHVGHKAWGTYWDSMGESGLLNDTANYAPYSYLITYLNYSTAKYCGVLAVRGTCIAAINGSTGGVDYSGTSTVFASVYATTGTIIDIGEGTFTDIPTLDPTGSGDRILLRGKGVSKTVLKSSVSNSVLFRIKNGSGYRFQDLTIDCMGIALCIDMNATTSAVQRNEFDGVYIFNATVLIDQSNSEENVYNHVIFGSTSTNNDYAVWVKRISGNLRFYNTIFQHSTKSNIIYEGGAQISFYSSTFTGGGTASSSLGQIYLTGTTADRVFMYEPWFETAEVNNINSTNLNVIVSINGGVFNTYTTSYGSNINGTYTRLDIQGTPTFISYNSAKNINIRATSFYAPTCLGVNNGINTQQGNSTYYWYYLCGSTTYKTNLTNAIG